jgi:hypothetical protein
VIAHRVDGVRRFAARTGDTRIVEEDYGTPLRKPVRHERIPVVKAAAEVLKEDERRSAFRAEAPVCVADSVGLDEADWSRDVGVFRHIYFLRKPELLDSKAPVISAVLFISVAPMFRLPNAVPSGP